MAEHYAPHVHPYQQPLQKHKLPLGRYSQHETILKQIHRRRHAVAIAGLVVVKRLRRTVRILHALFQKHPCNTCLLLILMLMLLPFAGVGLETLTAAAYGLVSNVFVAPIFVRVLHSSGGPSPGAVAVGSENLSVNSTNITISNNMGVKIPETNDSKRQRSQRQGNILQYNPDNTNNVTIKSIEELLHVAQDGRYGPVWRLEQLIAAADHEKYSHNLTEVSIAYFVQIGETAVPLLARLFLKIHHPDNIYILHVDAKVPQEMRHQVRAIVSNNPDFARNMHFLPSEMLTYKGISMALNTLAAITLARKLDGHWHYFINLSGTDYPLLSPTAQRMLMARPRVAPGYLNFMTLFPEAEWRPYSFRVSYQFWDAAISGIQEPNARLSRMKGHPDNPLEPFRQYTFAKAEAWMILSRPFCDFLVRSAFAKRMLINHVHVLSAPEHFFANVLYNHPFWRKTLVADALRKVVWYHHNKRSGQHPYVLDEGAHDFSFWLYLEKTRSLFARKFSKPDAPILDRIDRELSGLASASSDPAESESRKKRNNEFFSNLASHFDAITQHTLTAQNMTWSPFAYPSA